ncbi:hypothetical protein VMCG_10381 [Cytospora schulzeri]|uniref:Uncharacterized protein n=1 Tax=Cytospora schulzeri TaxID=448051 RepID=A0A423VC86_9PEZI|nr:hypothetical protein VMCG_10381 [Valsa malicola]
MPSQINVATPSPTAKGPTPQYLCTMTLNLGGEVGPIPLIQGNQRRIEIITSGTITGSGFSGKVQGGHAAPIIIAADASTGEAADALPTQIPIAYVYGTASDGSPFYIEQSGVGTSAVQNARLDIQVGGKYENLQRTYVIAEPTVNAARTAVSLNCWTLPLPK